MTLTSFLLAIIPSAAVLGLFIFVIRVIIRADRHEREAIAQFEVHQDADPNRP